jgi:hypothetical protein
VHLENAADDGAIAEHVLIVMFHSQDEREADARLRIREDMTPEMGYSVPHL